MTTGGGAGVDRVGTSRAPRVTFLSAAFSDAQVLRAECLVALTDELGWPARVVTTQAGDVIPSLRGSAFAERLARVTRAELSEIVADDTDVLCTLKALPVSLGLGLDVARATGTPVLADLDDPDIEARTVHAGRTPVRSAGKMLRDWRRLPGQGALAARTRLTPSTVSNPVLRRRWGGVVVPHARRDPGPGAAHTSGAPLIAFVGTAKRHKGIDLLRAAVADLAPAGWRLLVTSTAPTDARPWERWTGPLDGRVDPMELTRSADVVVIPSLDFGWAKAQLPLKLVDAMLLGRAVVVSDVGPLPWAVGRAGVVFRAGSQEALVAALRPLADPAVRGALGAASREEGLRRWTPERIAPAFCSAVQARVGDLARRT